MMNENKVKMEGHVLIRDQDGEVIVDKKNAIHYENMSHAIALSLGHRGYGFFSELAFGNGASTIAGTGAITYFPSNVEGPDATLYNATYSKLIDDNNSLNTDDTRNYVEVIHIAGNTYTDLVTHCYLDYSEPNSQDAFDDTGDANGVYVFDEIGIISYPENGTGAGKLLTHCVFSPVQKSLNRAFDITYTIRIYMAQ